MVEKTPRTTSGLEKTSSMVFNHHLRHWFFPTYFPLLYAWRNNEARWKWSCYKSRHDRHDAAVQVQYSTVLPLPFSIQWHESTSGNYVTMLPPTIQLCWHCMPWTVSWSQGWKTISVEVPWLDTSRSHSKGCFANLTLSLLAKEYCIRRTMKMQNSSGP